MLRRYATALCYVFMGLLVIPTTYADNAFEDESSPSVRFSGFGTVGYVAAGNSELFFCRDISQSASESTNNGFLTDSRLGIQANINLNADWDIVTQLVSRYKAQPTLANSIEWAFISYRPTVDSVLRLGRVGMDVYALSDFRNVGYAYNWVRPPTEFYGWIPIFSVDGIDFTTNINVGDTLLHPKFFAGQGQATIPIADLNYQLKAKNIMGASLLAEYDVWRGRVSYSRVTVDSAFPFNDLTNMLIASESVWPQAAQYVNDLNLKGSRIHYASLALSYDDGDWQVQSELSHTKSDSPFMPLGDRGYVSVGRRFGEWLPFVSYSKSSDPYYPSVSAPPGFGLEPLASITNQLLQTGRLRQFTWSTGVRWDFASRMALKFQLDESHINGNGTELWDVSSPNWPGGSRRILSTSLDFIF